MWSIVLFSSRTLVIQYWRLGHLDHPLCHCISQWPELGYWPLPDTPPLLVYLKVVGVVRWDIVRYQRVAVTMRTHTLSRVTFSSIPLVLSMTSMSTRLEYASYTT